LRIRKSDFLNANKPYKDKNIITLMQVIVDTSFIIHCMRKRIDFVANLESKGLRVVIPREVSQELQNMHHDVKTSVDDKNDLNKILDLIGDHKRFKRVSAGGGRLSDWLMKQDSLGYFVATLDKSIKHKLSHKVILHDDGTMSVEE
jgi:rRNA-processing protein FCF1